MSAKNDRRSDRDDRPRPGLYRLRLPGPTAVPDRVRAATAAPMVSHRGAEIREILAATDRQRQRIPGTQSIPLRFGCTGTGVMEAALVNVLAPGERALVVSNGQWRDRFAMIGTAIGA